jgi:hypothetical protein
MGRPIALDLSGRQISMLAEMRARGRSKMLQSHTNHKGRGMAQQVVKLHRLKLSFAKLRSLPPEELYAFALAGHVFNELMMLQKMVLTSAPPQDSHPFVQDAGVGKTVFVLRLLVGKTEEAMKSLSKKAVIDILKAKFFAPKDGLTERWDAAVLRYAGMPWLNTIRNQRAFHYMTQGQWQPHFTDELLDDAYVIVGATHGNTFFHWNEMAAALPLLKLVDADDPLVMGLSRMLEETAELLSDLGTCLAEGMQHYMRDVLTGDSALGPEESIAAVSLKEVVTPYFHAKD